MPDKPNRPPGPPMTLGNMRENGVHQSRSASTTCRDQALIDVVELSGRGEGYKGNIKPHFSVRSQPLPDDQQFKQIC
jgi:hypothetical protein